jgi:hypothetical protein
MRINLLNSNSQSDNTNDIIIMMTILYVCFACLCRSGEMHSPEPHVCIFLPGKWPQSLSIWQISWSWNAIISHSLWTLFWSTKHHCIAAHGADATSQFNVMECCKTTINHLTIPPITQLYHWWVLKIYSVYNVVDPYSGPYPVYIRNYIQLYYI